LLKTNRSVALAVLYPYLRQIGHMLSNKPLQPTSGGKIEVE